MVHFLKTHLRTLDDEGERRFPSVVDCEGKRDEMGMKPGLLPKAFMGTCCLCSHRYQKSTFFARGVLRYR